MSLELENIKTKCQFIEQNVPKEIFEAWKNREIVTHRAFEIAKALKSNEIDIWDALNIYKGDLSFLYLICNPHTGLHKIGITIYIKNRLKVIRSISGCELILVSSCCCNGQEEEIKLHKKFANKRKIGEWFDLSKLEIAWIKKHMQSLQRLYLKFKHSSST